ncbi:FAD-dependent oxidoreductase [Streptomyces sp. CRN 30]|uniref:FAD-dependent oxidoreductase n=1 Tax=Streptomyces sp. CRN 30 TaxID=3075613 RepID=UPI002A7FC0C4|nr:FAD-dependent oxidoreductase [Streptomyces sp. CRN 30]
MRFAARRGGRRAGRGTGRAAPRRIRVPPPAAGLTGPDPGPRPPPRPPIASACRGERDARPARARRTPYRHPAAAAEAGADVVLVERYGFLGGNATAALVMPLMSFHNEHRQAAFTDAGDAPSATATVRGVCRTGRSRPGVGERGGSSAAPRWPFAQFPAPLEGARGTARATTTGARRVTCGRPSDGGAPPPDPPPR